MIVSPNGMSIPLWWFCAVYKGDDAIFHSTSDDITPSTGEIARKLCEWIIIAEYAKEKS